MVYSHMVCLLRLLLLVIDPTAVALVYTRFPIPPHLPPIFHTQTAADAKFANYTAKRAFLFPGQGAQSVGMAKVSSCVSPLLKELVPPDLVKGYS